MPLSNLKKVFRRFTRPAKWYNLRNLEPVSNIFGLERGTPVDRYYIDNFLNKNRQYIKGITLEIADNSYSKKYGSDVLSYEILHYNNENPDATIIGDLSKPETLPQNRIDCFICTQTLQFIYNFKDAIKGASRLLKPGGIILATVPGISQVSKYDMERWGDYWRFTGLSAAKAFAEVFGKEMVEVTCYGNVLSTVAFLEGISAEELTREELDFKDENYPLLITILARKAE